VVVSHVPVNSAASTGSGVLAAMSVEPPPQYKGCAPATQGLIAATTRSV